jgi:serine/threonine protein kinase
MQGSLEQRLQPAAAAAAAHAPLSWTERVRICKEVAQGLIWLHTQEPPILHMDLKTANVLLDGCGVLRGAHAMSCCIE